jgi:hypothetical protein
MWASERKVPVPALVGGVFLVLGLPFLLGGVGQAIGRGRLLQEGARARGVVANGEGKPWKLFKSSGEAMEIPAKIRFTTNEGREIEILTPALNALYAPPNEPVELVYPSRQPHAAAVLGFRFFWLSAAVLSGVGALLVILGVVLLRARGG